LQSFEARTSSNEKELKDQLSKEKAALNLQFNSCQENLLKQIDELQLDNRELAQKYLNQIKIIERLMQQKSTLIAQFASEVKQNGQLLKEKLELQQSLQLQTQVLINLGVDSSSFNNQNPQKGQNDKNVAANKNIRIPPPQLSQHKHKGDVIVLDSGGWLSSVPVLGRLLGSRRTFKRTFEVVV